LILRVSGPAYFFVSIQLADTMYLIKRAFGMESILSNLTFAFYLFIQLVINNE